jgi:antitoxin MazE
MEAVVRKWGNDFGVRIPTGMAQKMSLKTGYKVYIVPVEQANQKNNEYTLESLLAGVTKDNIHKEISFGKPVGKEIW